MRAFPSRDFPAARESRSTRRPSRPTTRCRRPGEFVGVRRNVSRLDLSLVPSRDVADLAAANLRHVRPSPVPRPRNNERPVRHPSGRGAGSFFAIPSAVRPLTDVTRRYISTMYHHEARVRAQSAVECEGRTKKKGGGAGGLSQSSSRVVLPRSPRTTEILPPTIP